MGQNVARLHVGERSGHSLGTSTHWSVNALAEHVCCLLNSVSVMNPQEDIVMIRTNKHTGAFLG